MKLNIVAETFRNPNMLRRRAKGGAEPRVLLAAMLFTNILHCFRFGAQKICK